MISALQLTLLVFSLTTGGTNGRCDNCFNTCSEDEICDDYGCKLGYYGQTCKDRCPVNCRDGISKNPVCRRSSGSCLSGCKEGFYGKRCNISCPPNCLNSLCCQEDGVCTQGCRKHWHGPLCMQRCHDSCENSDCDRNGICKSCIGGFWGLFCEHACSPNCLGNSCTMASNGRSKCSKGCRLGWKGADCQTRVWGIENVTRISRASSNERCYTDINGTCVCCRSEYTGDNCTISCPNCRSKYIKPRCHYYCANGFYGLTAQCEQKCDRNCVGENSVPICNETTGRCEMGCKEGYYGKNCQYSCSKSCIGRVCSQFKGSCQSCSNKTQGDFCENDCSDLCEGKLCSRWNGSCLTGCVHGKFGVNCTYNCSETCKGRKCILTIYGYPICTDECVDTYRGRYCEERCPVDCLMCPKLEATNDHCLKWKTNLKGTTDFKWIIIGILILIIVVLSCALLFTCFRLRGSRMCPCPSSSNSGDSSGQGLGVISSDDQQENSGKNDHETACNELNTSQRAGDNEGNENQSLLRANNPHDSDPDTNPPMAPRQTNSQSRNGVRPDEAELGLHERELSYLCERLEEIGKREEGRGSIREFLTQLGYSEENTPSSTEGNIQSMLEHAPNLRTLETKPAMCKLIVALRIAKMVELAQDLTKKYKDFLPHEFLDEIRKQRDVENKENKTVSYGNPEQQQEQNGGTASENFPLLNTPEIDEATRM